MSCNACSARQPKVVEAGQDWAEQHEHVLKLVESSMTGENMFAGVVGHIVGKALKETIEARISSVAVDGVTKVDRQFLETWKASIAVATQSVQGIDALETRRLIDDSYRNQVLKAVPVRCVSDEIEFRLMAAVKGCAIQQGGLEQLQAEELLGYGHGRLTLPKIDRCLLEKALWKNTHTHTHECILITIG